MWVCVCVLHVSQEYFDGIKRNKINIHFRNWEKPYFSQKLVRLFLVFQLQGHIKVCYCERWRRLEIHFKLCHDYFFSLFNLVHSVLRIKFIDRSCFCWDMQSFPFYPCNGKESIVYGSSFRNGDFDGFTRYEVSWILKSHF